MNTQQSKVTANNQTANNDVIESRCIIMM